jgi:hypothetical protein
VGRRLGSQDSDPNRAVTVVGDLAPANVFDRIAWEYPDSNLNLPTREEHAQSNPNISVRRHM